MSPAGRRTVAFAGAGVLLVVGIVVLVTRRSSSAHAPLSTHAVAHSTVPATDGWQRIPGPAAVTQNASILVATADRIVVLGGFHAENRRHVAAVSREGASYDLQTGKWTTITPAPFTPFAAVWTGDRLFVAGSDCASVTSEDEGAGIAEKECPASRLRVATYDPKANQWTPITAPDLGYEIGGGNGIYGSAYTIGSHVVLRLARYDQSEQREITTYEAWSEPDGWMRLSRPAGFDDTACQASGAIASLSYVYAYNGKKFGDPMKAERTGQANGNPAITDISLTTLGPNLRWSKLAGLPTPAYEFEPEFVCAGDNALVWEAYHGAKFAFAYDTRTGAISSVPTPRGGYPAAPYAVSGVGDSALIWDDDGQPTVLATLEYDSTSRTWAEHSGLPATQSGQKPVVTDTADLGASIDGRTFIAREHGYNAPDKWWTTTLP